MLADASASRCFRMLQMLPDAYTRESLYFNQIVFAHHSHLNISNQPHVPASRQNNFQQKICLLATKLDLPAGRIFFSHPSRLISAKDLSFKRKKITLYFLHIPPPPQQPPARKFDACWMSVSLETGLQKQFLRGDFRLKNCDCEPRYA